MKYILFFTISWLCTGTGLAQDGNIDARYLKSKKLDNTYEGSFVHLVFAARGGGYGDTLKLAINNNQVPFLVHGAAGKPYGLFYAQYWQSVSDVGGYSLRLIQSRVEAVSSDSLLVTSFFDCYNKNGALAAGKSLQQQYWFSRKAITGLYIKTSANGL